jgi:hypothetical protein
VSRLLVFATLSCCHSAKIPEPGLALSLSSLACVCRSLANSGFPIATL